MDPPSTLCGQNAESYYVEGGTTGLQMITISTYISQPMNNKA